MYIYNIYIYIYIYIYLCVLKITGQYPFHIRINKIPKLLNSGIHDTGLSY